MLRAQPNHASTISKYAPLHSDVELNNLKDAAERVGDTDDKQSSPIRSCT